MGYNPTIPNPEDDMRLIRRERLIQAETDAVSMADLLDFIGGDPEAQGFFEALLQEIRTDATTAAFKLSVFLDRQAEARAEKRHRRVA